MNWINIKEKTPTNLEINYGRGYFVTDGAIIRLARWSPSKQEFRSYPSWLPIDIDITHWGHVFLLDLPNGTKVIRKKKENKPIITIIDPKLITQSINELFIPTRAYNCLINADIKTIGQLILKTEDDLLKIRKLGRGSVTQIIKALKEYEKKALKI